MTTHANHYRPLVPGPTTKLESLFADWIFICVADGNGRHYPAPNGYYLFHGLPGSLGKNSALFVKPHEAVRLAAEIRLANGVIGAFRCVRSAHFMKEFLLPVYVTDPQHIASPLLALVSYGEHERFEGDGFRDAIAQIASPANIPACGASGQVDGAQGQGSKVPAA